MQGTCIKIKKWLIFIAVLYNLSCFFCLQLKTYKTTKSVFVRTSEVLRILDRLLIWCKGRCSVHITVSTDWLF